MAEEITGVQSDLSKYFGNAQPSAEAQASPPEETPSPQTEPEPQAPEKTETAPEPEKTLEGNGEASKEEKPAEAKPAFDWESEDNPYRKKFTEIESQYKATRDWASQVNGENASFRKQLEIINKKLDGTYDPAVDDPRPDPQQALTQAQLMGKVQASEEAAKAMFGKETVEKAIQRFDALFASNPMAWQRVKMSPAPIIEAMKVLKEYDIVQKYGSTDVDTIVEKIKAEAIAEHKKELTEQITKQVYERLGHKEKAPEGLRVPRQASEERKPPGPRPFSSFFHN